MLVTIIYEIVWWVSLVLCLTPSAINPKVAGRTCERYFV